jgi:hypothetical protein
MSVTAQQIGEYLEDRIRSHGENAVVFYNDLAAHFDLPEVDERWQTHPLCKLFDVLDHEDARKKRPFRTALVISRDKQLPGQGFFNMAKALRNPTPRFDSEIQRMRFFVDEVQALVNYYKSAKI